jgi:hemerythrin-like domain-containing protein
MMRNVHQAFVRDITRLVSAFEEPTIESATRIAALKSNWELFNQLLENHHLAEDAALFPTLRSVLPSSADILDEMERQHHSLDDLLHHSNRLISQWAQTPTAEMSTAVHSALSDVRGLLSGHLSMEEEEALPLVEEHLSVEQWGGFTSHNMALNAKIDWTMPWLAEGQPPEAVSMLWSFVPDAVTSGKAREWTESYQQMISDSFRTPN